MVKKILGVMLLLLVNCAFGEGSQNYDVYSKYYFFTGNQIWDVGDSDACAPGKFVQCATFLNNLHKLLDLKSTTECEPTGGMPVAGGNCFTYYVGLASLGRGVWTSNDNNFSLKKFGWTKTMKITNYFKDSQGLYSMAYQLNGEAWHKIRYGTFANPFSDVPEQSVMFYNSNGTKGGYIANSDGTKSKDFTKDTVNIVLCRNNKFTAPAYSCAITMKPSITGHLVVNDSDCLPKALLNESHSEGVGVQLIKNKSTSFDFHKYSSKEKSDNGGNKDGESVSFFCRGQEVLADGKVDKCLK